MVLLIFISVLFLGSITHQMQASVSSTLGGRRAHIIIGLNPALQRTVTLQSLNIGSVNRAQSVEVGIGGKGQDVYVAASCMGLLSRQDVLLAQFLGQGAEGDLLERLLTARADRSVVQLPLSVRTTAPLRTCTSLVDSSRKEVTEIVEPSGSVSSAEVQALVDAINDQFLQRSGGEKSAGGVVVMGSMPPGCPPLLYRTLLECSCDRYSKVLLDTSAGVLEAVATARGRGTASAIKLNARELCALAGVKGGQGSEASEATSGEAIDAACTVIEDRLRALSLATSPEPPRAPGAARGAGAEAEASAISVAGRIFIAVTDGPYPAHVVELFTGDGKVAGDGGCGAFPSQRRVLALPPLPGPVINPIGAGDAVSAGTIFAWSGAFQLESRDARGETEVKEFDAFTEAFRWGLACGAASCLTHSNSVFELETAKQIFRGISILP